MSIKEWLPEGDFVNENGDVKRHDLSDGEIPPLEIDVNKYINTPVESGASVKLDEKPSYKISRLKFYNYINSLGLSPDDGCRHFNVTLEEVGPDEDEFENDQSSVKTSPEVTKKSIEVVKSGLSVNLAKRAIFLTIALTKDLLHGEDDGYNNEEFYKAFGVDEMIAAGYDPEVVKLEAWEEAHKFHNEYSGPANEEKRKNFLEKLEKQIK